MSPRPPFITDECREGNHDSCPEGRDVTGLCACECHRLAHKAETDG